MMVLDFEGPDRKAMDCSIRYISRRQRSAAKVREHLLSKGFSGAIVDRTLATLEEYGYIDDRRFAEDVVRVKSLWSAQRISSYLQNLGVDNGAITEAVESGVDDLSRCITLVAARGKRKGFRRDSDLVRLCQALIRQGFSAETVRSACLRCGLSDPADFGGLR